jgi:hypothetical protein
MGTSDLLRQLQGAGFTLALADGGGIRVSPASALTDEHIEAIRTHKTELIALLAVADTAVNPPANRPANDMDGAVADACCWPHSDAMNGAELDAMVIRLQLFERLGVVEAKADNLADRLVSRDRQHDDRRLCLECAHLGDRGRCLAAAAGRLPADRCVEPVPDVLRRCPAFGLRKGLT